MVDANINLELGKKLAEEARHKTVLDNVSQRVCRVYATALYQAAEDKNQVDEIALELNAFDEFYAGQHKLHSLFGSPVVSRADKAKILVNLFSSKVSTLISNFVQVVNEHDRLELLGGIFRSFRGLVAEKKGLVIVLATSAQELGQEQKNSLQALVEKKLGQKPFMQFLVDETILGGLVIRAGDWLWDGSLLNQYRVLRGQLIERTTYEIQSGRDSVSH
ncbi:MAG: ATP synthase F1 subunit delta [Gemmataceae bacterium]|nr:ATP synthase F1 subunit delta [Gemmataceae bacterium]